MTTTPNRTARTIVAGTLIGAVAIGLGVWLAISNSGDDTAGSGTTTTTTSSPSPVLPTEEPPAAETPSAGDAGASCEYLSDGRGDATLPAELNPPASGTVQLTLNTSAGAIGITMDRAAAPCTVNSMESLAAQGYFDNTVCHRLTTSPSLEVLQCGDPTGTGAGGPGYSFADENLQLASYSAGTVAMANAGPNTNGSQFFLVYGAAQLSPAYTVFGAMDQAGLDVVKAVAAAGTASGGTDGAPATPVTIETAALG